MTKERQRTRADRSKRGHLGGTEARSAFTYLRERKDNTHVVPEFKNPRTS